MRTILLLSAASSTCITLEATKTYSYLSQREQGIIDLSDKAENLPSLALSPKCFQLSDSSG